MSGFMGGSAAAMAGQVADGNILLSPATIRKLSSGELGSLRFELEKLQREVRGEAPPQDDAQANQARNRRISRINSALQVVQNKMMERR